MNRCSEAVVVLVTIVGCTSAAVAAPCSKWSRAQEIGRLDPKKVDESSGLAVSRKFDLLYHNNDSGTGPEFWVSGRDGSKARAVKIKGYVPKDPEEIAVGPCPGEAKGKSCLALGDIGDNSARRKSIAVFFVEERETFPEEVEPFGVARFRYPDGAHDAEAMAVMPNGDLVIVTKEGSLLKPTRAAIVYRARSADVTRAIRGEEVTLARVGTIDVPTLMRDKGAGGLVTAMSVTSDGSRFVLLTYANALEVEGNLSAETWTEVTRESARVVGLTRLQGQESVSYDRNERDLLYSTEQLPRILGGNATVPLMKVSCLE